MPSSRRDTVFWASVALTGAFVAWGALRPRGLEAASTAALAFISGRLGWFYPLTLFTFLVFSLVLAFGPYGRITLGPTGEKPAYSTATWFSMLFSAGMGIGIIFYGVAEPVLHYMRPPMGAAAPRTPEAAQLALQTSFFHWGLHAWSVYTVIGLALAYAQFRKGEPGLISGTFRPLFGSRVDGPLGRGIDVFATLATVFGVATSLGLGTLQINSGLEHLFGFPNREGTQLALMAGMTVLFTASALSGVDRGIKFLSTLSMALTFLLLGYILVVGPTSVILSGFMSATGDYVGNLVPMSLRLSPFKPDPWMADWTLFYWAWWIAWAPFVGMFIARISKGRTVREFVLGVLLAPTLLCAIWFAAFGGSALSIETFGPRGIAEAVVKNESTALFVLFRNYPLGAAASLVAVGTICFYFVSSADSATLVLGMFSSKGSPSPSAGTKLTWGVLQCIIAAILLHSDGLKGLQKASIVAALPFAVLMLLMMVSLIKALRADVATERREERAREEALISPR